MSDDKEDPAWKEKLFIEMTSNGGKDSEKNCQERTPDPSQDLRVILAQGPC